MDTSTNDLREARACRESGNYESALLLYRRVVSQAPHDSALVIQAHIEMGMVLGFIGMFDESICSLQESTRFWPDSASAHLNLGKTLLMLSEYAAARPALEQAALLSASGALQPDSHLHEEASKQLALLKQAGY